MKQKITYCFIVITLIQVLLPFSLLATPSLTSLQINEDIAAGPNRIYLTVTGIYSDGTSRLVSDPIWSTSNQTIATITYNGVLHFTGEGGALSVRVYKDGISTTKTLTVAPWPEKIKIETDLIESANPYRLMLLGEMSDGEERYLGPEDGVVWSTSNPFVAWVNTQGIVTFTGEEGYVNIRAVVKDLSVTDNVQALGGDNQTTAWRKGIKITEDIEYSKDPLELTLVAFLTDGTEEELDNSSADWSSSNKDVALVDSEGVLRFTGKPGFTTIEVVYGGYRYEEVVSVGRFIAKLSINQSLNYTTNWDGNSLPLSATVVYNDGSEYIQSSGLVWSIDNNKVAEITSDGILTLTGEVGTLTITAVGQTGSNNPAEDTLTVEVPDIDRPVPQRLFIDNNPLTSQQILAVKAYCIYSDGSLRDVSDKVAWTSGTSDTASVFRGNIYLTPIPGAVRINASYQGLNDQITGYNYGTTGNSERMYQLRIKQHGLPFSYKALKLTALVQMGDGNIKDVTSKVTWRSSQPLIALINNGVLTYTGRTGKTSITIQGYGFRDRLELEITPAQLQLQVERLEIKGELTKGAVQLKAIASYNDGTIRDVTTEAVWNTNNKNRAIVTSDGMVMFLDGFKAVEITASFAGQEASVVR
ncbi:MAG: hypothetical protein CVU87_08295 [Firmicutes bacterium HGW-Firmicutes-12]|nr:MAG: hypothetical protein CVU87_08295 [Firmicutes bacterium HGW-Firmicutes-12]